MRPKTSALRIHRHNADDTTALAVVGQRLTSSSSDEISSTAHLVAHLYNPAVNKFNGTDVDAARGADDQRLQLS